MSFVFDKAAAKDLTKAFSFDVRYETANDGKKLPNIDVPEFSLGGLRWQLVARPNTVVESSFGIWMELTEECREALAPGYKIGVWHERTATFSSGARSQKHWYAFTLPAEMEAMVMFFDAVTHYDMTIEISPEDIHPHCLQFVNEVVAKTKQSNCKIILEDDEDKPIYVNKDILAVDSPFFRSLFFGDFNEKNNETVKLGNVMEGEFLEYLHRIYHPIRPFAFKRLEVLLRLADRYHNNELLTEIESFLLERPDWTSDEKCNALEWADAFKMPTVFAEIAMSMDKSDLRRLDEKKLRGFWKVNREVIVKRLIDSCNL